MAEQELEQEPGTALAVTESVGIGTMLQAFMTALTDPRVDAAKMPVVADTLIKLTVFQQQQEFSRDKAAAISEMPIIDKKGRVVIPAKDGRPERLQSRYSKWEDMNPIVSDILARHNIVLTHLGGHQGTSPTVTPVLMHANGYVERGEPMLLPLDNSGNKNAVQGVGSALSYGQRYSTILVLNIKQQNVDDDGQSAGKARGGGRELNETEERILSDGRAAAKKGGERYVEWFRELPAAERGWLVTSGEHDKLKKAAGVA